MRGLGLTPRRHVPQSADVRGELRAVSCRAPVWSGAEVQRDAIPEELHCHG